jgi:hypothetical protein
MNENQLANASSKKCTLPLVGGDGRRSFCWCLIRHTQAMVVERLKTYG